MSEYGRWANASAVTIPQILREAVQRCPDKVWMHVGDEELRPSMADKQSDRLAVGLMALGVAKGDRVCAFLDTSADTILLWLAVTKLGAVMVPINTSLRGTFLSHHVRDSGAIAMVVEGHYIDRIIEIEEELPELRTLICRGDRIDARSRFDLHSLDEVRTASGTPPAVEIAPGDLATLIYTSGTTGPSKGCMLSHNTVCNASQLTLLGLGITGEDRLWIALPLFHLAGVGLSLACLRLDATLILARRFSVSGFWGEIERSRATAFFALSTMLPLLADAPVTPAERRCHGQLRLVFGAPFLREMQDRWKARFGVRQVGPAGYAMTECSPMVIYPGRQVPAASTGVAAPCLDVRILASDGTEAPPGTPGEIVVRPRIPNIMFSGYWRRPEATAEAFRDLWFHTGDIGKIDAEGNFFFIDRMKDYLRNRGENISSFELEDAFRSHPDIAEVAVHAITSELSEDEVKATLVMRDGHASTEQDICLWAITRLPYFAVPRFIEFRPHLPQNAVGRILKFELRAEGVTPATWDRVKAGVPVPR